MKKRLNDFIYRLISPFLDPFKLLYSFPRYARFIKDMIKYCKMEGAEPVHLLDVYPCLHDKTQSTKVNCYFYQDIWAFRRIYESKVRHHVDVGSDVIFVGMLTAFTNGTFIDIRPLETSLDKLECKKGDILSMPFEDNSLQSLSCLCVAEHIGLGRYGDPLDPMGTRKAIKELARVLAVNGDLYFSVPVGKPKLCFNAHRIFSSREIISYFQGEGLDLVEFLVAGDYGVFKQNPYVDVSHCPELLRGADYALGLFWFKKVGKNK